MTSRGDARDESDEAFLDLVFERAVVALEDGAPLSADEALAGRHGLRREVERLLADARTTACMVAETLPDISGYSLIEELGRGGMGVVYLARQHTLGGRLVALKLLPASVALSSSARARFLTEARSIANLRHPSVVMVHDVIDAGAVCAYSMEWVDGASLGQLIRTIRAATAPPRAPDLNAAGELLALDATRAAETYPVFVCRIGVAIARALGALHRAGLVHRDVKPSNVLLRRDGTALLSDFGLVHTSDAELTRSGQFVGTLHFASPEQLEGGDASLDARTDVYALGVTLYQALTLHLPFADETSAGKSVTTPTGMLRMIEGRGAAPLRSWNRLLPRDLETIVSTAIEPDPVRRYASADALADDLERLLNLQPIQARPASVWSRVSKFLRRNRSAARGVIIGSVLSFVLAIAVVVYVFLVPRWVERHVREARLTLLDPRHSDVIFSVAFYGLPEESIGWSPRLDESTQRRALQHYDAALRWAPFESGLRDERDTVAAIAMSSPPQISGAHTSAAQQRNLGLRAYLRGEIETALQCWERFEAQRPSTGSEDPLVDAALGVLHLARDEPARAYPRLREACRLFPGVGYLTAYLADAAQKCGDLELAERLLSQASELPKGDTSGGLDRVRAELRSAQGRDTEAEAAFRLAASWAPASLSFARHLERRGRREEALDRYVPFVSDSLNPAHRAEYDLLLERWWRELSTTDRRAAIRATLDLEPAAPRSLVCRLRLYLDLDVGRAPVTPNAAMTRAGPTTEPLELRSLSELGEVLRVADLLHWYRLVAAPRPIQALQHQDWLQTTPECVDLAVRWLVLSSAAPRVSGVTADPAPSSGSAGVPRARVATRAPGFCGLGDIPGGAHASFAECLSSDGTTVGGGSSTERTASDEHDHEAFLWRSETGMVLLGALPGQATRSRVFGVSADGSIAVGLSSAGASNWAWGLPSSEVFRWTSADGMQAIGRPAGGRPSIAASITDDGSMAVGWTNANALWTGGVSAVTWTPSTEWVMQAESAAHNRRFVRCSRNGRWVAGWQLLSSKSWSVQAARWCPELGWQLLEDRWHVQPNAITDLGLVVGERGVERANDGESKIEACAWLDARPLRRLGMLPGGRAHSSARGVLRDGSLIVGESDSTDGLQAVLWDEARALHRVVDVLAERGVAVPEGWRLTTAADVVRIGEVVTLCGTGLNPAGQTEAWIASY